MWYKDQVRVKTEKVVVKLKDENGNYKDSCNIPSMYYPLNDKYEIFSIENTNPVKNPRVLEVFDSVEYQIGKCYANTLNLVSALQKAGYNAKSYVGWLFTSKSDYPIHHCWAVLDNSVLDLSDDFSVMFSEENKQNFNGMKTADDFREAFVSFQKAARNYPNHLRCAPVGTPTLPLFYVGCECDPNQGRIIYNNLMNQYPNHVISENIDNEGYNKTQRYFQESGIMK